MQRALKSVLVLLSLVTLSGAVDRLGSHDVKRVIDQLLDYHIQVKEVSPALLQRSWELYLQQFDPNRCYCLEDEVRPFLQPTPEQLEQALLRYQADDLQDYAALDQLIQRAITRAQSWREQLYADAKRQILSRQVGRRETCSHPLYCRTEEKLRARQLDQLVQFGERQLQAHPLVGAKEEVLEQAWGLHAKQAGHKENPYLYLDYDGKALVSQEEEHLLATRAIKALAQSLDSHTAYYSPAEAYQLKMQLQQGFAGVGLELKDAVGGVVVSNVIEGGPAARSRKIQPNDRIVAIDGESIANRPYSEVLSKIRGRRGSRVVLGIKRRRSDADDEISIDVTLKRDVIRVSKEELGLSYQYFGEGLIGVVRLDSFFEGASRSAEQVVRDAITVFRGNGELAGLVLDLRFNLGGFLSQAVKVAGLFITNGVVAISKYSDGVEVYFRDIDGVALYQGPMIVLTSKASASAAEIVAQALQDYGQALIVGDPRTYGKGSIQHQTITDEDAEDYFKVTVGRYYTVSGRSTQVTGVEADIIVPTILYREPIGEEYLEYPLEPDQIQPAFDDTLDDLNPTIRQWFIKYYLPTLQQRREVWRQHLPILRKNSEHRLETSRNFKLFLESLDGAPPSYGQDDLQLIEAINILKDMILLNTEAQQAA